MKNAKIDIDKLIDGYYESDIHQYYSKVGEKRASSNASMKIYANSPNGKAKLKKALIKATENAAKVPFTGTRLKGAQRGGKIIGGSLDGKKRMSELGSKYGKVYGGKFLPKDAGVIGKQNLLKEFICEKCGNKVNRGNYTQFHGKKCREADKIKLINSLPDKFTKAIVKEIAEKIGIKDWIKLNILHHTCPYVKMYKKVDKPNQYNPCWYKKVKSKLKK
jgi:hypothetical protein